MAVKLVKGKKAAKPVSTVAASAEDQLVSAEVVDEYMTLKKKMDKAQQDFAAKHAATVKRMGELQSQMMESVEPLPAEEGVILQGSKPELGAGVEITAKKNVTSITDLTKVKKYLTDKVFMALAKVNIGDLDKYLTPAQKSACTKTERSGSRSFKVL